jgi:chromosome segregation ATPase
VEWETAHEVVGPKSPLSRLRAAIEELHAARRDIEHKLAEYRTSLAWRFTRTAARRDALERRVEADFARDYRFLQRQLQHLNATIAAWDEDWTRSKTRPQSRSRRPNFRPRRKPGGF